MKVQRPVREDVELEQLETVRVHFYVLVDPTTGEVRYVGQTVDLSNRMRNHIWESKKKNVTYKHRWIVSLLRRNLKPTMQVLGSGVMGSNTANRIESQLIRRYGKKGRLTNLIDRGRNQSVIVTRYVNQYTYEGVFVARYPNANRAALEVGGHGVAITAVCDNPNGRGNRSRHGFLWSYDGVAPSPLARDYRRQVTAKAVEQLDSQGHHVAAFDSARKASQATGVCHKRISAAITGRQKTAGGFQWRFVQH